MFDLSFNYATPVTGTASPVTINGVASTADAFAVTAATAAGTLTFALAGGGTFILTLAIGQTILTPWNLRFTAVTFGGGFAGTVVIFKR